MPTPTDLVTDLPADFEVFGQAVDTSLADLRGGTTGQVLSKTTNADMDFTWVSANPGDITEVTVSSPITGGGSSGSVNVAIQDGTTAQKGAVQLENSTSSTSTTTASVPAAVKTSYDLAAAAIPKSTVTTNGDLIYGTGSATVSRIGIGSTGDVLTVAAGIPSWAAPAGGATFVGCRVYKSAGGGGQTISNNTATALTFDSEEFDTDSFHSTSTNTSRITIPAGKGGKYLFEGFCILTNGTGDRNLDFNVNGSVARYLYQIPGVSSAIGFGLGGAAILNLNATDYVELIITQSSGTNRTTGTGVPSVSMACTYLGA